MERYEGATMIKSFRGQIVDGGQDIIVLHTNDGSTGYKIVRFELFPQEPGETQHEHVMKIYKVEQTTVDNTINFSDNTLLGAAFLQDGSGAENLTGLIVTFDREIFNQDIYITHVETVGSEPCNYYIELEQIKLDLNANTVATLKNLKNLEPGG